MLIVYRGFGIAAPAITVVSVTVTLGISAAVWGAHNDRATGWGLFAGFLLAAVATQCACAWIDRWAESSNEHHYKAPFHSFYFIPLPIWIYINGGFAALCLLLG